MQANRIRLESSYCTFGAKPSNNKIFQSPSARVQGPSLANLKRENPGEEYEPLQDPIYAYGEYQTSRVWGCLLRNRSIREEDVVWRTSYRSNRGVKIPA